MKGHSAMDKMLIITTLLSVLLDFTSAQDYAAIERCALGLIECETKAYTESCGAALQCLNNLKSTCSFIGYTEILSPRIKWYEYKCSAQGQADYEEYTSCLTKADGLLDCLLSFSDESDSGDTCVAYGKYQNCLKTKCGEGTARYVHNELEFALSCTTDGGTGGTGGIPQDALYQQCSADQGECEARTNCGETLECLINVRTRCNIFAFREALSLRIKFYEYKCSSQGQADGVVYQTCLSSNTGVIDCSTVYYRDVQKLANKPHSACTLYDKFEQCVKTNCGEAAGRYLSEEVGSLIRFACSGSTGGIDFVYPRFCLVCLSFIFFVVKTLY